MFNETPGIVGPRLDPPRDSIRDDFLNWSTWNGYPFWPFWEAVRRWWAIRSVPNVYLTHFEALKADLPGEMRRIADVLDIRPDPAKWDAIVDHCSFPYMNAFGKQRPAGRRRNLHPQGHQRALARRPDRRRHCGR